MGQGHASEVGIAEVEGVRECAHVQVGGESGARDEKTAGDRVLITAGGANPESGAVRAGECVASGAGNLRSLAYTSSMTEIADTFDSAFTKAVDLGNRLADRDKDADLWDIADGLLAGALQYWLYSRQPCGDPRCQDCMPISTAEGRMAELKKLVEQLAAESEYFHTPTDANAGRA
jgi:hypothetical protein